MYRKSLESNGSNSRLRDEGLFAIALKYAPSYHPAKWLKFQKLLMVAGESQELTDIIGKISRTISKKSGGTFTFNDFLDYTLGGTSTQYQKFFRNIELQKVTQNQLDEAVEFAAKHSTPEKAAQVFHDEVMRIGNENVTNTRKSLDNLTTRESSDKQKIIDAQLAENPTKLEVAHEEFKESLRKLHLAVNSSLGVNKIPLDQLIDVTVKAIRLGYFKLEEDITGLRKFLKSEDIEEARIPDEDLQKVLDEDLYKVLDDDLLKSAKAEGAF